MVAYFLRWTTFPSPSLAFFPLTPRELLMAVGAWTHMPLGINRTVTELADRAPPSDCLSTRITQRTRLFACETAGKCRWDSLIFSSLQIMRHQHQAILLRGIAQGHPPHFEVYR